jgi:hypothetical protein
MRVAAGYHFAALLKLRLARASANAEGGKTNDTTATVRLRKLLHSFTSFHREDNANSNIRNSYEDKLPSTGYI